MPTAGQGTELLTREDNLVQLVTPEGERVNDPDYDPWIADIFGEQLLALYEDMVVIRRIDAEAVALQRQGQLGLWAPLKGQEASQVGSARALRSDDFIFPSYRENGVAYIRGVDLTDLIRVWRGTTFSGWNPYDHSLAVPQIIVGAHPLHAVGYALGCKFDGTDTATIAYFGDGATSEGDISEAMVFAATYQVPVVLFCQNNQWAISEPVGLQARQAIADRAPGFGIPSMRVDGNDVLAVMAAQRRPSQPSRAFRYRTLFGTYIYRLAVDAVKSWLRGHNHLSVRDHRGIGMWVIVASRMSGVGHPVQGRRGAHPAATGMRGTP